MPSDLDALIAQAGVTHVIPAREDDGLLQRLRDPRVFDRARELLGADDRKVRESALLCIERIGYVLRDQQTAEILLEHAEKASDRFEIRTALESLQACTPPHPLPAEPLLRLARRREWQIWHPAVRCLHLAPSEEVEPVLYERLDSDPIGLIYVAFEFRYMHSAESLSALDRLLGHSKLDVRCVALDSLGERLGEEVVSFARRLAKGRHTQEKWWAEKWLSRYGDASDVTFMARRLKNLVGRGRAGTLHPPEVSYLVPFLLRFEDASAAQTALAGLGRRAGRLPESERAWVEENEPMLIRMG